MRLTDQLVATLTLPDGKDEIFFWDDEIPGFGVRLRRGKGGKITKRWVCQYKPAPRRSRRSALGAPGLVRCAAARARARELLARVRLGGDPQGERIAARRLVVTTFGQRAAQFLDEVASALRQRTRDAYRLHLMVHARPLHHRPIGEITRSEIAAWLSGIARERGRVAANRTRATGSAMFAWCVTEHEVPTNPVVGTRVQPESSRDRTLNDAELAAIWRATADGSDYSRIVKLLMLTAARRDEIGRMKWHEIDGGIFTLPAERSKNHTQHEIPLSALALAQLPPRMGARDAVFGRGEEGFSGWSRCKARLDAKSGVVGWTLHDLRRSAATWMSENGIEPAHVDAVLNHIDGTAKSGIRGIYNRAAYTTPKKAALAQWSAHIAAIAGQTATNYIAANITVNTTTSMIPPAAAA